MFAKTILLGVGMLALEASAVVADPLSWQRSGDAWQSSSTGFAYLDRQQGRVVSVSAEVTPESCSHDDWATVGVAVYRNAREFWHLALVKQPENQKSRHSFELAMMHEGRWPVQNQLTQREWRVAGGWEFGKTYALELNLDKAGVRGTVKDVASGKVVFVAAYAFTAPAADRGCPALHVTGNLQSRLASIASSVAEPVADETIPVVPYPAASVPQTQRRTGFFRLEESDGRWQAIDPNGAPFVVLGVDHVHPWGMFCESLGYSPYGRHVKATYKDFDAWGAETLKRLKSWGFTALGAGCDQARLARKGLVHTDFLNMGCRLCTGDPARWIREYKRAPCTAFPNVFHPDFTASCDWIAAEKCAAAKDDPWLFGYFIDNELAWWGSGGNAEGMFNAVKALPADHAARQALEAYVAGRTVTKELKVGFLELVADRYFAVTTAAIRKYDPNHLVLGCRFAGLGGAHDVVWQTAAKYCDLVTFNCYPWADIDRNVVMNYKGGRPIVECFDELYAKVKRPMLVTEWSFPALDTGRPCLHGAGQRFKTQEERVAATELFAKTMLALPYFIGYDYFMWVDQPAQGINRFFPEDSNYGLVQENGTPHKGITEMFKRLHGELGKWTQAPLPAAREVKRREVVSEREKFYGATAGASGRVTFVRGEKEWTLTNGAGLELKGFLTGGEKDAVASVVRDGRRVGSLGVLLETELGETVWKDAREVRRVEFTQEGPVGVVRIVTRGEAKGEPFEMTLACHVAVGRGDFVAEIERIENLGKCPLPLKGLYLRPFAAGKDVKEVPGVPNLWQGAAEGAWELADGTRYGLVSGDADVRFFHLWINPNGGQHPDVAFAPSEPTTLAPGQAYTPPRPLSARVVIGGKSELERS